MFGVDLFVVLVNFFVVCVELMCVMLLVGMVVIIVFDVCMEECYWVSFVFVDVV